MNKKIKYVILSLFVFYSGASSAVQGGYLGVGFGNSKVDISDSDADDIEDTDTFFKIIGGIPLQNNFSIEFGYVDFGSYSAHYPFADETDKADANALYAAALGKVAIGNGLSLFGKLGLDYWTADVSADYDVGLGPQSASGDGSDVSLMFGIGLAYDLSDNLSIRAELEKFTDIADGVDVTISGFGSVELDGSDADLIGASLIYTF
jgi:opacity protein-like surface antigen